MASGGGRGNKEGEEAGARERGGSVKPANQCVREKKKEKKKGNRRKALRNLELPCPKPSLPAFLFNGIPWFSTDPTNLIPCSLYIIPMPCPPLPLPFHIQYLTRALCTHPCMHSIPPVPFPHHRPHPIPCSSSLHHWAPPPCPPSARFLAPPCAGTVWPPALVPTHPHADQQRGKRYQSQQGHRRIHGPHQRCRPPQPATSSLLLLPHRGRGRRAGVGFVHGDVESGRLGARLPRCPFLHHLVGSLEAGEVGGPEGVEAPVMLQSD